MQTAPSYSRTGSAAVTPAANGRFTPRNAFQGSRAKPAPPVRRTQLNQEIDAMLGKSGSALPARLATAACAAAPSFVEKLAMKPLLALTVRRLTIQRRPSRMPSVRASDNKTPSTNDMAKSKDAKGEFKVE
jgi:hypothetical protein